MFFSAKTAREAYDLNARASSSVSVLASIQFLNWSRVTRIGSWSARAGLGEELHSARRRLSPISAEPRLQLLTDRISYEKVHDQTDYAGDNAIRGALHGSPPNYRRLRRFRGYAVAQH